MKVSMASQADMDRISTKADVIRAALMRTGPPKRGETSASEWVIALTIVAADIIRLANETDRGVIVQETQDLLMRQVSAP